MCMHIYIYIYIYTYKHTYHAISCRLARCAACRTCMLWAWHWNVVRSISEISSCCFGPRPWHIEIRHRVEKTSTIDLFGFETLKLTIRRLKLWKPTVICLWTCGNESSGRYEQSNRIYQMEPSMHWRAHSPTSRCPWQDPLYSVCSECKCAYLLVNVFSRHVFSRHVWSPARFCFLVRILWHWWLWAESSDSGFSPFGWILPRSIR